MDKKNKAPSRRTEKQNVTTGTEQPAEENWKRKCLNCGATPTVGDTGLCEPCLTGEADTVEGDW